MTARVQTARTGTNNTPPGVLPPGQLYVEMANPLRLWTGVPTSIDATGRRALVDATNFRDHGCLSRAARSLVC